MNATAAERGDSATGLNLPRMNQWAFLRFLLNGSRGSFAAWREAIARYPLGFETRLFGQRCIVLNDPEHIEALLVKNQKCFHRRSQFTPLKAITGNSVLTLSGEAQLRQRRLMQPAFKKERVDAWGAAMAALAETHSARWRDGDCLDVHAEMLKVTAAIIAKTMFSSDVEEDALIVGHAINALVTHTRRYVFPAVGKTLDRLPLKSTRLIKASIKQLDAIIYRFIHNHRAAGEGMDDLLSMLIAAQYDDGSALTDRQLRDESMTMFLAGHETIATALSWTFYLLSQNPHIADLLHAEVDAVLEGGRTPSVDDLPRLDYAHRVLSESMRLYPPVPGIDRQAVEPNDLAGITINVGDLVLVSQMVVHHDPRWFPDPERFDPDRWLPGHADGLPKFAYFPFGGGSRRCIGERFALMEGVLLLAIFSRDWKFALASGARVQSRMNITLRPAYGLRMIAHRRQRAT